MEKITLQQRNLFYKKALEQIESEEADYICEALSNIIYDITDTVTTFNKIPYLFPEFKQCEPKHHENTDGGGWWNDGKIIRIKILKKCIALTNQPPQP